MAEYCHKKSVEPHKPYYVTSSQDAQYVNEWLKRNSLPYNGMYLNKAICKSLGGIQFKDWMDTFDYFSKLE